MTSSSGHASIDQTAGLRGGECGMIAEEHYMKARDLSGLAELFESSRPQFVRHGSPGSLRLHISPSALTGGHRLT
jgi:hypothetical protein